MTLNFPNRSRSYDERGRRVRFWGSDGAFEISFFVEQAALGPIASDGQSIEAGLLRAFDRNRERILDIARKLYSGRRAGAYVLLASDFH